MNSIIEYINAYPGTQSEMDIPVYYWFLEGLGRTYSSMIEVGCRNGAGSACFLMGGGVEAYGIDTNPQIPDLAKIGKGFTLHRTHSTDPALKAVIPDCDIVFIDADHEYASVRADYEFWRSKAKCLMLFDDVLHPDLGTSRFWRELDVPNKFTYPHLHPGRWGFGAIFLEGAK